MSDIIWTVDGLFAVIGIGAALIIFLGSFLLAEGASVWDYVLRAYRKIKDKNNN